MIRTVAETGSTNDDLAALARDGALEGTWLRAERQTGGKGRQGRGWLSPPGNLYASTLIRLRASDPPAPSLALASAVALHEALSDFTPGATIKWPNDLLIGGAKVAGILLERVDDAVIAGFGVNIAHHPEHLDRRATSLSANGGPLPTPAQMLDRLAARFAAWLARWREGDMEALHDAWRGAAHPVGTALSTHHGEGIFEGLERDGALRLRLADGTLHVIRAGDVFLI